MAKLSSHGVLWARTGFAPAAAHLVFGCDCLAAYFDVDYYGRVFYPEDPRFRVGILDTNGNVITHFGRYGNRDASLDGTEVPLAFPVAVAASDNYIYVADILSGRLVRAKIEYACQEEISLK